MNICYFCPAHILHFFLWHQHLLCPFHLKSFLLYYINGWLVNWFCGENTCHGTWLTWSEIRGRPRGVASLFPPCGWKGGTQIIRLGSNLPYGLSHNSGPSLETPWWGCQAKPPSSNFHVKVFLLRLWLSSFWGKPDVRVQTCDPVSTEEPGGARSQVQNQPGLYNKTLSSKRNDKRK